MDTDVVHLIRGYRAQLGKKRSVFVGFKDGSDNKYIRFINDEGDETYIRLSLEAGRALSKLLRNDFTGADEEVVTHKERSELHWVVKLDPEHQA